MAAFLIGALFLAGCSKDYWIAQLAMLKAEKAYEEAFELRVKKEFEAERRKLYEEGCEAFLKAYRRNPKIFTLHRIQSAADACQRVGNPEAERIFERFGEEYELKHPTEVEYGDAVDNTFLG